MKLLLKMLGIENNNFFILNTFQFIYKYNFKLIISLIFLFISYKFFYIKNNNIKISKSTFQLIKKINEFITICRKGILINGIRKSSLNIKVTVVITLFNNDRTIKTAIRSVRNQKMSDLEILTVEDCSTDNSLQKIEELKNEDKRIKIIKNKKNKGALYSKSIGALNAKGKYIVALDSDDLFINEDLFNICYQHAEENIDIVEFSGFSSDDILLKKNKFPSIPYYLIFKKNNEIIRQPELSTFIYQKENNTIVRLIDGFICAKFIKSNIYKKSLQYLGDLIFTEKINYGEDRIVNFVLFRIANSFKYIEEYGFIYYNNPSSITNSLNNITKCHDELINIMSIFNITKNSYESQIVVYELNYRWNFIILPGLNEENKNYVRNMMIQILNSKYITETDKKTINLLLIDTI